MATFDRESQRIIVRIVYDGVAGSGKTTNLRQASAIYATRRRGELVAPDTTDGHTAYFDLVQLEGGAIAGSALRCQLMTVPGAPELLHRRVYLLRGADVVIHVCDSAASALEATRAGFERLREALGDRLGTDVPLVVQANRRDATDAVPLDVLSRELGLTRETPILAARAHEGIGVRETVVQAIRAAAHKMQEMLQREGLEGLPRATESWEELHAALRALEPVNARAPSDPDDRRATLPRFSLTSPPTVIFTRPTARPPSLRPVSQRPPEDTSLREASVPPPPSPPSPTRRPPASQTNVRALSEPPLAPPANDSPPRGVPSARAAALFEEISRVPVLDPDAPDGFVWPHVIGRRVLALLARERVVARASDTADGSTYDAGPWVLQSGAHRRYDSRDAGRAALQRVALTRLRLDTLFQADTVLALEADTRNGCQLWTLTPRLPLVRDRLIVAAHLGDELALGETLCLFADAVVAALRVAARHGVVIEPLPEHFAIDGERAVYTGDELCAGSRVEDATTIMLRPLADYAHLGEAIERYLVRYENALTTQLSRTDVTRLGLVESLDLARSDSPEIARGAARLMDAIRRCREQAAA